MCSCEFSHLHVFFIATYFISPSPVQQWVPTNPLYPSMGNCFGSPASLSSTQASPAVTKGRPTPETARSPHQTSAPGHDIAPSTSSQSKGSSRTVTHAHEAAHHGTTTLPLQPGGVVVPHAPSQGSRRDNIAYMSSSSPRDDVPTIPSLSQPPLDRESSGGGWLKLTRSISVDTRFRRGTPTPLSRRITRAASASFLHNLQPPKPNVKGAPFGSP